MLVKYLRYPFLGLITFTVGIVISPIHFYEQASGCGRVIDGGGGFSVTSYKSSYFVNLSFAHSAFVSPEKANQVFNEDLREAVQIFEVTPKINTHGMTVGRRAVVIFFDPELNKYYASVFWTDGRRLHAIYSRSYLHVIEFEKHNLGVYAG
jgi:hypothetical protein